jgi:hypothetical protein
MSEEFHLPRPDKISAKETVRLPRVVKKTGKDTVRLNRPAAKPAPAPGATMEDYLKQQKPHLEPPK